ncbi:urocortin [Bombina bombina]|uniref:urocortin n=1 Tax=Bombina bombina TaxID=8345 RepID=UPI00235ABB04|nr:urocortin [Bombina bombina]
MKTTPFTLLTCYLILTAHAGARPLSRNFFEGPHLSLNGMLSDDSAQTLLYFLREKFQREVEGGGDPQVQLWLSKGSLSSDHQISAQELAHVFSMLQTLFQENVPNESTRSLIDAFSDRLKREDPPISIDLTFHILRQMIEIAKTQNQKQQAEQNRIIFDSVGK